jgi:exodeoxyribonuclease VII small subunit
MSSEVQANVQHANGADGSTPHDGSRSAEAFEAAFHELENVVEQLEAGGLALEASLALFEKGSDLVRRCTRIVDEAELRLTRLLPEEAAMFMGSAASEPAF